MEAKTLRIPRIERLDSLSDSLDIRATLDESGVSTLVDVVNWQQFPAVPHTTLRAAYSSTGLYLDFEVENDYVGAENTENQSPVSKDECVEAFLQPQVDGEYWNFEFNCIGAINASHRLVRPEPVRLTADELALVRRDATLGSAPFAERQGDFRWRLLIVIPWSLMAVTPIEGTVVRGNFYKCASASQRPHYLSWNPIATEKPDYHRPEFFGALILD